MVKRGWMPPEKRCTCKRAEASSFLPERAIACWPYPIRLSCAGRIFHVHNGTDYGKIEQEVFKNSTGKHIDASFSPQLKRFSQLYASRSFSTAWTAPFLWRECAGEDQPSSSGQYAGNRRL